ncbi:TIGR03621 family F420-dependent LLM class oxidoreductase [Plantactinospora sp. CA-290183]|uniref:TIGR03621 family F420-dependent LLM class oxidoreductase n=1 Tax=Plantactinospora sp. CA-290183 TaxID=3240006 RepID=UPI003D8B7EBE
MRRKAPTLAGSGTQRMFRFGMVHSGPPPKKPWPEYVRNLEGMGYQTVLLTDHMDGQLSPTPALAAAAMASPTVRLGCLVLNNDFYRPAMIARDAATLHHLSEGRFELGLGAGWDPRDYDPLGVELQRPAVRLARLAESIRLVRSYLAGQPFSFTGAHYQVRMDEPAVAPVEPPGPPIIVGAGGPRALRLAGELADIVSVNPRLGAHTVTGGMINPADVDDMPAKVALVREGAGDRMDRIELSVSVYAAFVTPDTDRAARLVARQIGTDPERVLRSAHVLVGSVDHIADTLRRRRDDWGVSYVIADELIHQALAPVAERLAGT